MSRGLQKLFTNLSIAARKVEDRKLAREKLRGYLQKVRIVAEKSSKKSASEDVVKLEKHVSEMLSKKVQLVPKEEESKKLKQKENELDEKIAKLNELLAQVGKKISKEKLLKQLEEPSEIEELENKLYSLESKYQEIKDNPEYPPETLNRISEKISLLKERIRELKK